MNNTETYNVFYEKHNKVCRQLSNTKWRLENKPENKKLLNQIRQLEKDKQALNRVLSMFS